MLTRATLTHAQSAIGADLDSHLVVSLVGEADKERERPRIGLVCVVDTSGSMQSASKLDVVRRSLAHLAGYLGAEDGLALITFNSHARVLCAPAAANAAQAALFQAALNTMRAGGSTNLEDALRLGVSTAGTLAKELSSNDKPALVRVLVLTDGEPTVGLTNAAGLVRCVDDLPAGVSLSALGVGETCDHNLLGAIARVGNGTYGFIPDASRAADILGTEVGGLLDTEARELVLTIKERTAFATIKEPLGLEGVRTEGTIKVRVGSLLAGQTRNIVLPVVLHGPKKPHVRPVTVAEVHVHAVVDDMDVDVELLPKVLFAPEAGPSDGELADIVELAQVSQAQIDAELQAQKGNFVAASAVLNNLHLRSGAASGLAAGVSQGYANAQSYAASSTMRSSAQHAMRGTLVGSNAAFDSLAGRTIGSYTTAGQRETANLASAAVSGLTGDATGGLLDASMMGVYTPPANSDASYVSSGALSHASAQEGYSITNGVSTTPKRRSRANRTRPASSDTAVQSVDTDAVDGAE